MSGARHQRKGDRIERELVDRHKALGTHAERCPLSGASRFRGSGHDLDIRRNYTDPLVLLPWRIWARILERVRS